MTNKPQNLWGFYTININHPSIISNSLIKMAIKVFWKNIVQKMNDDKHIIVLFRIVYPNDIYNTLGQLQRLNKNEQNYYISYINDILSLKNNEYKSLPITKIIINYGIRDGITFKKENIKSKNIIFHRYKNFNLPVTLNPLEYGNLIYYDKFYKFYIIQIRPMIIAKIIYSKKRNKVDIIKSDKVILSYEDKVINSNTFERIIGSNHYIYINENGKYKLDLFSVKKPVRFIESKKLDDKLNDKIITLDIETYDKIDEQGITQKYVYNLSWFDGVKSMSYYITEFNNHHELIYKAISDLTKAKYHSHMIYIHNLANFDGVFLLKELTNHGIVDPIIHKGRIVTVSLTYSNKKDSRFYTIHFRDSYQLLMSSLSKLAINFKVQTLKGIFPHRFVKYNNLNYIGPVPSFEYFDNISKVDYNNYINTFNKV